MNRDIPVFSEEITGKSLIPKQYLGKSGEDYSWFRTCPKYTTLRCNTLRNKPEELKESLRESLLEWCSSTGHDPPEVWVDCRLPECVVVGGYGCRCELDDTAPSVVIDLMAASAVLRGAPVYAPAVLAVPPSVKVGAKVNIYADLLGKCRRGTKHFDGPKEYIGRGSLLMDRHALYNCNAAVRGLALEVECNTSKVPRLQAPPPALAVLQNLPSIACCYALDLSPGLTVLDMCAAPGNKTTHIAALMSNKGRVFALEKVRNKAEKLSALVSSLQLTCVEVYHEDARRAVSAEPSTRPPPIHPPCPPPCPPPFPPASFDRVLLDAPCSALGQRPNLRSPASLSQISSFPKLQRQLFEKGVEAVRGGGVLVYSTCSVIVEENEGLVSWALQQFPCLSLAEPRPALATLPPVPTPNSCIPAESLKYLQRFGPSDNGSPEGDSIGFFFAKFIKKSV